MATLAQEQSIWHADAPGGSPSAQTLQVVVEMQSDGKAAFGQVPLGVGRALMSMVRTVNVALGGVNSDDWPADIALVSQQ